MFTKHTSCLETVGYVIATILLGVLVVVALR
jgi:hypothetical protein